MSRNQRDGKNRVTRAFRSDLRSVCELEFGLPPALLQDFRNDLEHVFDKERLFEEPTSDEFLPEELKALGNTLIGWGKTCRKELSKCLSALPRDHPVRCPISLFGTMDYGRLETAHTRTLAWLLDPEKEHGFGQAVAKALLRLLPDPPEPKGLEVQNVVAERFYREPGTSEAVRNDIWIEGRCSKKPWLMVIEAKVDAEEGDEQLARYDREIREWQEQHDSDNVYRVFLTPKGRTPA